MIVNRRRCLLCAGVAVASGMVQRLARGAASVIPGEHDLGFAFAQPPYLAAGFRERFDVIEFGVDRIVAIINQHVLRHPVV